MSGEHRRREDEAVLEPVARPHPPDERRETVPDHDRSNASIARGQSTSSPRSGARRTRAGAVARASPELDPGRRGAGRRRAGRQGREGRRGGARWSRSSAPTTRGCRAAASSWPRRSRPSPWIRRPSAASTSAPRPAVSRDVLLERGAAQVVALDVGRGQLDWRLRSDPRVVVVEGVNARMLAPDDVPGPFGVVTVGRLVHLAAARPPGAAAGSSPPTATSSRW